VPTPTPTPVVTPAPSGRGAWALGKDTGGATVLERVGPNLTPQNVIAGGNTLLDSTAVGMSVDPSSGNVWVLAQTGYFSGFGITGRLTMFPSTANGNVAPSATIAIQYFPAKSSFNNNVIHGLALDGAGNAFTGDYPTQFGGPCELDRISLTSGATVSPVAADTCTDYESSPFAAGTLQFDRGFLYLSLTNPSFATFAGRHAILRYTVGAGGSLARNAVMAFNGLPDGFGLDNADDVLANDLTATSVGLYPASNFVPGQTTTAAGPADTFPGVQAPVAVDNAGNIYVAQPSGSTTRLAVIPSGSHGVYTSVSLSPLFIAPAR
jgi:hypothetical protein